MLKVGQHAVKEQPMTGTWKVRACSGVRVIIVLVVWKSVSVYDEATDDGHLDGGSMT